MDGPHRVPGIEIRELGEGEEIAAADLVMRVFAAYVGHEYSARGVEEFARYADASALRERLDGGKCIALAAVRGDALIGVIEFRGTDHLSLLFVDDRFHRRGIARALLSEMIEKLAAAGTAVSSVEVNSSRDAIPAYRRLGFEVSGPERTVDGITFTPMRRR